MQKVKYSLRDHRCGTAVIESDVSLCFFFFYISHASSTLDQYVQSLHHR